MYTGDSHLTFPSQLPRYPMEDDVGHASPGHMEEHDFMTAFFQNQEDEDTVRLIHLLHLYNTAVVILFHTLLYPCLQFGEYSEMEEDASDGNVENYIADFFGHTPDTKAQNVRMYSHG